MGKRRDDGGAHYTDLTRLEFVDGKFFWKIDGPDGQLYGTASAKLALSVMLRLAEIFFAGAKILPFRPAEPPPRPGSWPAHG